MVFTRHHDSEVSTEPETGASLAKIKKHSADKDHFIDQCNVVSNLISNAKVDYYSGLIEDHRGDPADFISNCG